MKKSALVFSVFFAVLFSASVVSAFSDDDAQPDLTHSTMVGTSDGGALVLYGHILAKYDSDLDVVKAVDIRKSSKPRAALPNGDDMMIRPSWNSSSSESSAPAPPAGTFRIPTLSEDKSESDRPKISEPSSEIQSSSS